MFCARVRKEKPVLCRSGGWENYGNAIYHFAMLGNRDGVVCALHSFLDDTHTAKGKVVLGLRLLASTILKVLA